jgi:dihydroorotate dehydrogenase (NAD+) catalytic subunit
VTALTISSGKFDLTIDPPWMNAAGFLGYSDEGRRLVEPARLGAFVTSPVGLKPRSPAQARCTIEYPGGFLLHTGLAGPGLMAVLRQHRHRWGALPCPVILRFLATHPAEIRQMADLVAGLDEVDGIELGLGEIDPEEAAALVRAAQGSTRPVLAHLPLDRPGEIAQAAVDAGACAVVMGPPRGSLRTPEGTVVRGRLYGPAIFPLALRALERLLALVGCPVIASGGVYSRHHLETMLEMGASAAQLDGVLWTAPEAVLGEPTRSAAP